MRQLQLCAITIIALLGIWLISAALIAPPRSPQLVEQQEKLLFAKDILLKTKPAAPWPKGVKIVVFWASWCEACRSEWPILHYINQEAPFKLIGINIEDHPVNAQRFLYVNGNPFSSNFLSGNWQKGQDSANWQVMEQSQITLLPGFLILDKNDYIKYRYQGPITMDLYQYQIKKALAKLDNKAISAAD